MARKPKIIHLGDKEKKELEILTEYLPEQMSEGDIRILVEKAIKETGASDIKEMGKVSVIQGRMQIDF